MEIVFYLFAAGLVLAIIIYLGKTIIGLFRGLRLMFKHLFGDVVNRYFLIQNLKPQYKSILVDCFPYYHGLNNSDKKMFEKRVQKFIRKKDFVPRDNLSQVTPEMKTLVAASAIQITFGLPQVYFTHFDEIHMHEDTFFSDALLQYNAGEVHKHRGWIVLSWKDFLEGYLNPTNARNVGLHEMAHALRLENMIKNEEYQYFDWDLIQELNDHTVRETEKINKGEETIFRPYAAQHYQEFFAVLIEVFFEQPKKLKAYNHDLFRITACLLKQNPLGNFRS